MTSTYISCDVITANNGDIERCRPFLVSLSKQTYLPNQLVVLLYTNELDEEKVRLWKQKAWEILWERFTWKLVVYWAWNSEYIPWRWIWYDRQFRLQKWTSPYVYLIDDDNEFSETFLESSFLDLQKIQKSISEDIIYAPTVRYADSKEIQSQWIIWFSRWKPKYIFYKDDTSKKEKTESEPFHTAIMMWWNSLLAKKSVFLQQWFDDIFTHRCEDIDMTYWIHLKWIQIVVSKINNIYHHERKRNLLESKFLSSDEKAYIRWLSRVLFASKHATAWWWIQYVWCWVRLQTMWFLLIMMSSGLWKNELTPRVVALIRWTLDWLKKVALNW